MADITQWEYKTVDGKTDDTTLNKLGEEGWEVSTAKQYNGDTRGLLLKRPKQSPIRPAPSDGYGYGR